MPRELSFPDKSGNPRYDIRMKWWDASARNYREAFLGPDSALSHIPEDPIDVAHLIEYSSGELQETILQRALTNGFLVQRIVLRIDPRRLVSLLRQKVRLSLDVARREAFDPVFAGHVALGVSQAWRALAHTRIAHVIEHAAGELGRKVGFQRP